MVLPPDDFTMPGMRSDALGKREPVALLHPSAALAPGADPGDPFRHLAFFYGSDAEYVDGLAGFVRGALARGHATFIAVPAARAVPLREALGSECEQVAFADMTELGRNPSRIIAAVRAFTGRHPGRYVSYVGEPAWAGRSPPELVEAAKHEALLNLAFAGVPATIVCPYEPGLPAAVLADARRTHPLLAEGGVEFPSGDYLGADQVPASCQEELPEPPAVEVSLTYDRDLNPVRAAVGRQAALAGLSPDRAADLTLAVSELAANTLRYTAGHGSFRSWRTADELVCEIRDQGWITDPLAGRLRPAASELGGQGLWVVNQVCDLVEMRTGPGQTVIRLHMSAR